MLGAYWAFLGLRSAKRVRFLGTAPRLPSLCSFTVAMLGAYWAFLGLRWAKRVRFLGTVESLMYLFGLWSTVQNQLVGSDDPGRQALSTAVSINFRLQFTTSSFDRRLEPAHTPAPRV